MPTRDASGGSYHGTTTANTAEVIAIGASADYRQGSLTVIRWSGTGDLWFAVAPAGDDIDIAAGQTGLHRIADGVTGSKALPVVTTSAVHVVLKSTGAVAYSVERA
jgi:hypothetical protein